ncbi:MAG: hypothetical protein ACXVJT_17165, partial [Thermoanaerobaculia bacterium]
MIRRFATSIAIILIATASLAQQTVPTPDEYLGYTLGDRFTPWDRIVNYYDTLTKASSLIRLQQFGQTYEGRPL